MPLSPSSIIWYQRNGS